MTVGTRERLGGNAEGAPVRPIAVDCRRPILLPPMRALFSLGLLLALAPLAACDALIGGPGTFDATVTVDDTTDAVAGDAVYTVLDADTQPRFLLGLFVDGLYESTDDDYHYVVFEIDGPRPGVGASAVAPSGMGDATATLARVTDARRPSDTRGTILRATSGTLTVASVDATVLAGSFQVTATGIRLETPGTAVAGGASGRFEARYEPPAAFQRLGLGG